MLLNEQFYDLVRLNKDAVSGICQTFDYGVKVALNNAQQAYARDDRQMLASHAHSLKGMCLNLGAQAAGDKALTLEELALNGNSKALTTVLKTLKKLLADTQQEMDKALQ